MQKTLLALATITGLLFAYVDARPNWDDTAVLAFAILLTCGVIALMGYKRPWLVALVVGGWIPLYGILVSHNYGSIIALGFAFAGAYAGWAVHAVMRGIYTDQA